MTSICLLALALAAPQDALAQPVSLQFAAGRTKDCVDLLAKNGVRLSVDEDLAAEPIIVRVKDKPLRRVMDAMADALGGTWSEQPGGYKLIVDKDLAAAEQAAIQAELRRAMESGLAETLARMKPVDWSGEAGHKVVQDEVSKLKKIVEDIKSQSDTPPGMKVTVFAGGSTDQSPAHDLLRSIVSSMTLDELLEIPYDETVVFSSSPTARQVRFRSSIGPALSKYVTAHNAMANAVAQAKKDIPEGINLKSATLDTKPIEGGIQKVLLSVRRDESGRNFSLSLKIADRAGKIVGTGSSWINALPETLEAAPADLGLGESASQIVEVAPASRELAVALSEHVASGKFSNVMVSSRAGGPPAKVRLLGSDGTSDGPLSAEARQLAAHPDRVDPLSLAPGELTAALADKLQTDLVAVLPDAAVMAAGQMFSEGQVAFGRIPAYLDRAGAAAAKKDGFLIVEPQNHVEARWNRVSRPALASLTSDLAAKGYIRLIDAAKYASEGHVRGALDRAYMHIFSDDWDEVIFGSGSTPRLLRIIGLAQPGPEIHNQSLAATSMSVRLKRELEALLYSTEGALIIGNGSFIGVSMGDGPSDQPAEPVLADEATEKYPNGLPGDAGVLIETQPGRALFIQDQANGRGMFSSIQELAMRMGSYGPEMPVGPDYKSDRYTYAVGQVNDVHVSVQIPGMAPTDEYYRDARLPSGAARVPFARIPADFADELKQTLEEMQNTNRIRFGGPGAGKTPPP